jgi:hypothetical protein
MVRKTSITHNEKEQKKNKIFKFHFFSKVQSKFTFCRCC